MAASRLHSPRARNLPVLLWEAWVSFPVCPSQLPGLLTLRHLTICPTLPSTTTMHFCLADTCSAFGCPSGSDLGMYGGLTSAAQLTSVPWMTYAGSAHCCLGPGGMIIMRFKGPGHPAIVRSVTTPSSTVGVGESFFHNLNIYLIILKYPCKCFLLLMESSLKARTGFIFISRVPRI